MWNSLECSFIFCSYYNVIQEEMCSSSMHVKSRSLGQSCQLMHTMYTEIKK
jgi:hypothetical protein